MFHALQPNFELDGIKPLSLPIRKATFLKKSHEPKLNTNCNCSREVEARSDPTNNKTK